MKKLVWILSLIYTSSVFAESNPIVTIVTPLGSFQMELLEDDAPITVRNFLNYLERDPGGYTGTFFHRLEPDFVLQGGGFAYNAITNQAPAIATDPPIVNEFGASNVRGTVAMAKLSSGPDTATNQWFVNLANNSANLDNQNGGFTVFARVIDNGMEVIDAIAALPRSNLDNGGVFSSTPTINFDGISLNASNFVTITSATVVSSPDFDNDGMPDATDPDDDNDGVPDISDAFPMNAAEFVDTDNDGTGNNADTDDDGDGVLDSQDAFPLDNSETKDTDLDGIGDNTDRFMRLVPSTVLSLPVTGSVLTSPLGSTLTVPSSATAVSLNVTVVNPAAAGFVTVWPCSATRPNASNLNFSPGQVLANGVIAPVGEQGNVCFFSSAPADLIVDIAGWFAGDIFVGATPERLIDSRDGTGTSTVARVIPNAPLRVKVTDINVRSVAGEVTSVPSSVEAVALNVTAVSPSAAGFVTVYPCDVQRPEASNLNYVAGDVVPNGVIAPVSSAGEVCVFTSQETDIIVDLAGWFTGSFTGSTPKRLVDTRDGTGGQATAVSGGQTLEVSIHGESLAVKGNEQAIPITATAAALNVTVVNPTAAGFVTVFPCGVSRPNASNLNYIADVVVANNVIAPIGENGKVCLFSQVDSDVIVDISGWFEGNASNGFVGATPLRLVDTRNATGPAPQ